MPEIAGGVISITVNRAIFLRNDELQEIQTQIQRPR